jgi:hypothetical protein
MEWDWIIVENGGGGDSLKGYGGDMVGDRIKWNVGKEKDNN